MWPFSSIDEEKNRLFLVIVESNYHEKKTHNLLARCVYAKDDVVAFKNRGKNAIFSNFHPFDFSVEGLTFHSVEQ